MSFKIVPAVKFININGAKENTRKKLNFDNTLSLLYNKPLIINLIDDVTLQLKSEWGTTELSEHILIKFIIPTKETKFITIGDLHGSLATFIRHLFRFRVMGILDNMCRLQNNYEIILLGDVIDRGIYDYELFILILSLIKINPNKVHYNKGNHEDIITASRYGFIDVINIQFDNDKLIIEKWEELNDYQSSAIVIKNPITNKFIYLSHGGLPILIQTELIGNKLKYKFRLSKKFIDSLKNEKNIFLNKNKIATECLYSQFDNIQTIQYDSDIDSDNEDNKSYHSFDRYPTEILSRDNYKLFNKHLEASKIKHLGNDYYDFMFNLYLEDQKNKNINTILWSDYTNNKNTTINNLRRAGLNIGTNMINRAKNNNIELIIRGHTDNIDNCWILKRSSDDLDDVGDIKNYVYTFTDKKIITDKYRCSDFTHKINITDSGVVVDNKLNTNLYNVITISTNTDKDRALTNDSFIILNFKNEVNTVCEENNTSMKERTQGTIIEEIKKEKEYFYKQPNIRLTNEGLNKRPALF